MLEISPVAAFVISVFFGLIAGVINIILIIVQYRRRKFNAELSPELKKYKKAEFRTTTNAYAGTLLVWLIVTILTVPFALAFTILVISLILLGDITFMLTSVIAALLMAFVFFSIRDANSVAKKWPLCPKHNTRLKITAREEKGSVQLLTFRCPEGDMGIKMLSKVIANSGMHAQYGRNFRGGNFGSGGFGGGRSGGGGAGR